MSSLATRAQSIADAYQPPPTGRPSEIADAPLLQELFSAVQAGNYLETACELVGLAPATVYNWKKRGQAGEAPYDRFLETLKRASAQAEAQAVANVRTAGKLPQFWAAEMTYLERRHPDRWGRRQDSNDQPKVVVNIGVGAENVRVSVVSPPTFAPDSPLEDSANSLTDKAFALPSSPIRALMLTNADACQDAPAAQPVEANSGNRIPKGTLPGAEAEQRQRKAASRKGSRLGRAGKKKASVGRQDGVGKAIE